MKTKILSSALFAGALMASTPSQADVFNGWYSGFALGYQKSKLNFSTDAEGVNVNSLSLSHIPANMFVGYTWSSPQSFLVGLEAGLGYNFKQSQGTVFNDRLPAALGGGRAEITVKQKMGFFAEMSTRLGWNFGDFAAYGILGVSGQQHELTYKATVSGNAVARLNGQSSATDKEFMFGFFPGVGAEVKVTDTISARFEYRYHIQKPTTKKLQEYKDLVGIGLKMRTHDFRIGVSYAL